MLVVSSKLVQFSKKEEGEVAIHLPIGPLKTFSDMELVPGCEPSTYQPISLELLQRCKPST